MDFLKLSKTSQAPIVMESDLQNWKISDFETLPQVWYVLVKDF